MAKWIFEPGHTSAQFRVRHMMVTWVSGHCKDIHGWIEFDPDDPRSLRAKANIDVTQLWTGEPARDAHLKSTDFLEVETYPEITFESSEVVSVGENDYRMTGELTIHGIAKEVTLDVNYLGHWQTPYWEEGEDRGPVTRTGFTAETVIDRLDFGVLWNDRMERDGVVVGADVGIRIDAEAILESDIVRVEQETRKTA